MEARTSMNSTGYRQPPGSGGAILRADSVTKRFHTRGDTLEAVADVSFDVHDGAFVSVCGPSGCGKTTLFKVLAGLYPPTSGTVWLRDNLVREPPDEMAIVFQNYAQSLMPWLTVYDNVRLPIRRKSIPKERKSELIHKSLSEVGLTGFDNYYPWQLSGGMQQRVAIARALAYEPKVLLLDEPFASVDAQTRAELQDLVLSIRANHAVTFLLVTHDVDEAVYLSDRVIVLSPRPARVLETVPIDLPPDRDQVETKQLPGFVELRARVFDLIRSQTN